MVVEFLLSHGIATWENLLWSFQATAHVDRKSVEELLRIMEEAWPEEVAGLRKLSVKQLIGLMATERDMVYSLKTTNNKADAQDSRTRAVYWEGGEHGGPRLQGQAAQQLVLSPCLRPGDGDRSHEGGAAALHLARS